MTKQEYILRCSACRNGLESIIKNQMISTGPFVAAIKYVLEKRFKKSCIIYSAQYGAIEFTAGAIRFKLLSPPVEPAFKMICKHVEGDKFIPTSFDIDSKDLLLEFLSVIDECLETVGPFDTE